ncbi:MAG: MiaB/RimO family radical SAM methylthiotransferase, partial [Thermoplasmatales archaeon]|nr:MiaB/RimO family radical SAM methylthiotransferase [Thermoplasmatales archaeon]
QAKEIAKTNTKEIVLTGVNTGDFGRRTKESFSELIKELDKLQNIDRIRISSIEPNLLTSEIIDFISESRLFVPHFHIPLQSGSNKVLKHMHRRYQRELYAERVETIKSVIPDCTISTDVIVGFPTETDEQFQHTIDLLKTVKPDITNVTRYSSRPHTKAKVMKGRVRTDVAKDRSKILTKLCIELSKENNRRHVGRKYTVLITEKGKNNTVIGRTENYKPVVIREKADMRKITPVIITNAASTYLFGRLI